MADLLQVGAAIVEAAIFIEGAHDDYTGTHQRT